MYFGLTAAILTDLERQASVGAELIVTRSISAGMGFGLISEFRRNTLPNWLLMRQWAKSFASLAQSVAYRASSWSHPLEDLVALVLSFRVWRRWLALGRNPDVDLAREVVGGIVCGDLVIDSFLRFRPKAAFDAKDPFVWRILWQVLRDARRANRYFARRAVGTYLTTYATYVDHGVTARVALQYGVSVYVLSDFFNFLARLTPDRPYQTPDCRGYRASFYALPSELQSQCLSRSEELLTLRLSGGLDPAMAYMRSSAYAGDPAGRQAGAADSLRGAVVVFLHDFYDSPHIWPGLVFTDFWDWICTTIETLTAADVPFFIKPHPNQISLSDAVISELRAKYPHVRWLDRSTNNLALAQAPISCGVTVYGTIANELAFLGIPTIGAAANPHEAFGFCRTATSRAEYTSLLQDHSSMPLAPDEMRTQALQFYAMHNKLHQPKAAALGAALFRYYAAAVAAMTGAAPASAAIESLELVRREPRYGEVIGELAEGLRTHPKGLAPE